MAATTVEETRQTLREATLQQELAAANARLAALTEELRGYQQRGVAPAVHAAVVTRAGHLTRTIATAIGLLRRSDPTDWATYPVQVVEIRTLLEAAVR